jgi:hypothetical protein
LFKYIQHYLGVPFDKVKIYFFLILSIGTFYSLLNFLFYSISEVFFFEHEIVINHQVGFAKRRVKESIKYSELVSLHIFKHRLHFEILKENRVLINNLGRLYVLNEFGPYPSIWGVNRRWILKEKVNHDDKCKIEEILKRSNIQLDPLESKNIAGVVIGESRNNRFRLNEYQRNGIALILIILVLDFASMGRTDSDLFATYIFQFNLDSIEEFFNKEEFYSSAMCLLSLCYLVPISFNWFHGLWNRIIWGIQHITISYNPFSNQSTYTGLNRNEESITIQRNQGESCINTEILLSQIKEFKWRSEIDNTVKIDIIYKKVDDDLNKSHRTITLEMRGDSSILDSLFFIQSRITSSQQQEQL